MKNKIIIDVDTDREKVIAFGKPPDSPQPENKEQAAAMVINDIGCLSEAIATLIVMADQNDYGDMNELIAASVKTISSVLIVKELDQTPVGNGPEDIELTNEKNEY